MYTDFGVSIPAVRVRYMAWVLPPRKASRVSIPAVRVRYIIGEITLDGLKRFQFPQCG